MSRDPFMDFIQTLQEMPPAEAKSFVALVNALKAVGNSGQSNEDMVKSVCRQWEDHDFSFSQISVFMVALNLAMQSTQAMLANQPVGRVN